MAKHEKDGQTVIIYCRVSTQEQGISGLGLEAQERICRQVAFARGWQVDCVVTEVCSGARHFLKRPELTKAVIRAHKTGAAILVKDISRLTRDMMLGQEFINKRIYFERTPELILADCPEYDQFYIDLMMAFAAKERRDIGKRTKDGLQALRDRGGVPGQAGGLKKRENALAKIAPALERATFHRQQGLTWVQTADALNTEGYTTSTGGKWYASNLSHWFRNGYQAEAPAPGTDDIAD